MRQRWTEMTKLKVAFTILRNRLIKNSKFLIIVMSFVTWYLKLRKITETVVSSVINVALIKEDFRIRRRELAKILRFIYSSYVVFCVYSI